MQEEYLNRNTGTHAQAALCREHLAEGPGMKRMTGKAVNSEYDQDGRESEIVQIVIRVFLFFPFRMDPETSFRGTGRIRFRSFRIENIPETGLTG